MKEWNEYKLRDITSFQSTKIPAGSISKEDYVSTENMIENKGGVVEATSIPSTGSITLYSKNNILISNIRPYFKKIWLATKNGGCSYDVLCFIANDEIVDYTYLYYALSQDLFFDYVMLGSKGCKMPRGDKSHILNWEISLPSLDEQKRIAGVLSSLDDKIDLLKNL